MKWFMYSLALAVFILVPALSLAQTQAEMDEQAYRSYQKTDSVLNAVYQGILVEYKSQPDFLKACREAELAWIKFRDAQVKMMYPGDPSNWGSILPMCEDYYLQELTLQRIKTLKLWLDGEEEGDACGGSVRIKR